MTYYIKKASGEKEPFNLEKFKLSLLHAGASEELAEKIVRQIPHLHPKTTKQIHDFASNMLMQYNHPASYRYNIKRAVMELGPAGYSFEKFIGQLFAEEGFSIATEQTLQGFCIHHEVDVVANKGSDYSLIECKFHNRQNLTTTIQTALYVKARFDDILDAWQQTYHLKKLHTIWLVTNTRFSSDVIKYARCRNIPLLSWSYPSHNNLMHLIEKFQLHPITVLNTLSRAQKRMLIKKGLLLCKHAAQQQKLFKQLGFSDKEIANILEEIASIYKIGRTRTTLEG